MGHKEIDYILTRETENGDVEFKLTVEFEMDQYIPATWNEPAEGGNVSDIHKVYLEETGEVFALTDEESQKMCEWIEENYEEDYGYDG